MARLYGYKVEGGVSHLLNAGVSQEDAREGAIDFFDMQQPDGPEETSVGVE